jgi:hypothetical protein
MRPGFFVEGIPSPSLLNRDNLQELSFRPKYCVLRSPIQNILSETKEAEPKRAETISNLFKQQILEVLLS